MTRPTRVIAVGAAVVVLGALALGAVTRSGGSGSSSAAAEPTGATATVERGDLAAAVSLDGTLTYRARADGSPYTVVDQATCTYTRLPATGDAVACGDELYRVDEAPVLLLCGPVPAYRDLRPGDRGDDVRQLNDNLHALGLDAAAGLALDPDDDRFTGATAQALALLQFARGQAPTGSLARAGVVVLPGSLRVADVAVPPGGPAEPGSVVLHATSDHLEVQVALQGTQLHEVRRGDPARITLPGDTEVAGTVRRVGTVATVPAGEDAADPTEAAVVAAVRLDDPAQARGLDRAPVHVEVATDGVEDVLSVPVTAIVGTDGGGVAVEVVRHDGRRELVAVRLGLVDQSAGRVQVEGDVREGDAVVVPSS